MFDYQKNIVQFTAPTGDKYTVDLAPRYEGQPTVAALTISNTLTSAPMPSTVDPVRWAAENGFTFGYDEPDQVQRMSEVLFKHREVFGDDANFGLFPVSMTIPTKGDAIAARVRAVPERYESVVNDEIERLLTLNVIEPCPDSHGWMSPIHVVDKKDGSPRVVVDFSPTLNQRIHDPEAFPSPNAEDLFNSLTRTNKFYSSLDLLSGYWELGLSPDCRHKTAFCWRGRVYQWARVPMGMRHSGNLFCKAVATALDSTGLDGANYRTYIDDVLMFADNFDKFISIHDNFLGALRRFGLRLKSKKCSIMQRQARFLGHLVSEGRIEPDPKMADDVGNMKPPTSKKEVCALCGSLGFIKSIIGTKLGDSIAATSFSETMAPIYDCLKQTTFMWPAAAQGAFDELKRRLSSKPFLSTFDPDRYCILATDASDRAAGCFLMQADDDGKVYAIGCKSKLFTASQTRWSTSTKEAFAVVYGVEAFSHFLRGRVFTLQTDHASLRFIDKTHFKNPMHARWQSRLQEFTFVCTWIPGIENGIADLLSRPFGCAKPDESEPKVACQLINIQDSDVKLVIPSHCINRILRDSTNTLVLVDPKAPGSAKRVLPSCFTKEADRALYGSSL